MRRVAVIVETSTQYGRNLIGGIAAFGRLHGWQLLFEYRGRHTAEPSWLEDFEGDGIITSSPSPTHSLVHKSRGIPVVDLGTARLSTSTAENQLVIDSDHHAVGRMAAEHFIEKGHRHFAFIGYSDHPVSREREEGFAEGLAEQGFSHLSHHTPERLRRSYESLHKGDAEFIKALPHLCGLFCCWDEVGHRVVNTAMDLQIAIPEDLAVLAVDNDPVFCATAGIPLSSIDPDIREMGFLTASWLDALMNGASKDQITLRQSVQPKGVVVRQSSALDAVDDPLVRKFLELLRQDRPGTLTIEQLSEKCHVSRRLLEQRVKSTTGKTPRQHLSLSLVDSIKRFLTQTDYTLAHIADILGFEHAERLSHLFRRITGKTPGEYRRNYRGAGFAKSQSRFSSS